MYNNGSVNNSLYMCVSSKHFHYLILTFNYNLDIKQYERQENVISDSVLFTIS